MFIFLIIIGIVALDQFTKFLVVSTMTEHQSVEFIKGLMNLTYKKNTGVAFGMLSEHRVLFMSFSIIMLVLMIAFLIKYRKCHKILLTAVAFLTGGGLGNMVDRLFRTDVDGSKFVVDFFEFDFVNFAIFNVADCFVTFGAILLIIYVLFFERKYPVFTPKNANCDENIADDNGNPNGDPNGDPIDEAVEEACQNQGEQIQ